MIFNILGTTWSFMKAFQTFLKPVDIDAEITKEGYLKLPDWAESVEAARLGKQNTHYKVYGILAATTDFALGESIHLRKDREILGITYGVDHIVDVTSPVYIEKDGRIYSEQQFTHNGKECNTATILDYDQLRLGSIDYIFLRINL